MLVANVATIRHDVPAGPSTGSGASPQANSSGGVSDVGVAAVSGSMLRIMDQISDTAKRGGAGRRGAIESPLS